MSVKNAEVGYGILTIWSITGCMGMVLWPIKQDSLPPLITTAHAEMSSMLSDLMRYPLRCLQMVLETFTLGLPG